MSSNPTHGYDTTSTSTNNEGIVPAVMNYVGLGSNQSTNPASDATAEPAFGAAVGPNSGSTRDGYAAASTLNPHDEDRAKVVADRAVGGNSSTLGSNEGGMRADARVGDSNLGGGSADNVTGVDPGQVGSESHRTTRGGSGFGLGSQSAGVDSQRESGVGLGSERSGSNVPGSGSIAAGDELTDSHKGNRAAAGESEGANSNEAQASSEPRSNYDKKPGKGQLENKSAIPVAGGIQLGEKHWGESDIVPENPKPRESEGGVSSASGQPDESTRDNTAANAGGPTNPSSGEQKEGIMDKVKDKLHIGGDSSKHIGSDHK